MGEAGPYMTVVAVQPGCESQIHHSPGYSYQRKMAHASSKSPFDQNSFMMTHLIRHEQGILPKHALRLHLFPEMSLRNLMDLWYFLANGHLQQKKTVVQLCQACSPIERFRPRLQIQQSNRQKPKCPLSHIFPMFLASVRSGVVEI